jgi:excisionase family DNA binding protein
MSSSNVVKLPTSKDVEAAKESSRTLAKYADEDRVKLKIESQNESDELILPGPVMQLLLDILSEMSKGNAINLMPIHAELSTQEAANILNVSRPHLVKLLESNAIPFHKVGSHRRVYAKDIFEYKMRIDEARVESLDKLTQLSQDLDMGY